MNYGQAFFIYVAALKCCDALAVLLAWYTCWFLRFNTDIIPITKGLPPLDMYTRAGLPLMLVFLVVLHVVGAYRRDRVHFGFRAIKKILQGSILGTMVFVSLAYFQGEIHYSRAYLILFSGVVVLTLLLERALLGSIWRWAQSKDLQKRRVLLVGRGPLLEMFVERLEAYRPYPVEWAGQIGEQALDRPIGYLGQVDRLEEVLEEYNIDEVVVSFPTQSYTAYADILRRLSNELVTVKVIPDFGTLSTFTYSAEEECGLPLLSFNKAPIGFSDRFVKRGLDLALSTSFLILFWPVYLLLALAVRISSKGPIIYKQERVGADGRHFTCYKFRTMRVDAEKETGPIWAAKGDTRTTRLGAWLRRTSLDELPQVFNVLIGNMSWVGPRPERPNFVSQFRQDIPKYMLRHKMKSGITGWAQVNGLRGNTSLEDRVKYDLFYISKWSHLFDIKILTLTPWTVLKGFIRGNAY